MGAGGGFCIAAGVGAGAAGLVGRKVSGARATRDLAANVCGVRGWLVIENICVFQGAFRALGARTDGAQAPYANWGHMIGQR